MAAGPDPVTVALTGMLPAGVIAGALLAYPLGRLLLRLYHRSVARSMALASGSKADATASPAGSHPSGPALRIAEWNSAPESAAAQEELGYLFRAPWQGAAVYAAAGAAFAAVMTGAWLVATRDEAIPIIKLALLFWTYFWPAVLTVNLVAGMRRSHRRAIGAYFGVFLVLVVVAAARNPSMRWYELPLYWVLTNGPPTVLLAAFLTRRIRAVGPMVLAFMILAMTGSQLPPTIAANQPGVLKLTAEAGFALGLGASQIFWGMMIAGLLVFALLGWLLLKWLGRRYQDKRLSDETLTVDALWLMFAVTHSVGLVFQGWYWVFTGLVAFAAFKISTIVGFSLVRGAKRPAPRTLLVLRVFALGARSERLFDLVRKHWQRLGNITLIAGPDLVTTTVEPHEFLEFIGGGLSRQFVSGRADLERRISGMDAAADPDGRHRVNEFFCHADTWQMTMHALAGSSHAVLMDLRGFSSANQGCLFELGALLNSVDLDRVLFVIDASTDRRFLESSLAGLWASVSAASPNRKNASPAARLLELEPNPAESTLRRLFAGLCASPVSSGP
jgi:hypothetical protein